MSTHSLRKTRFWAGPNRHCLNQLHALQKKKCFYCGGSISFFRLRSDPHSATVDHFIPLAAGGLDDFSNVVLACLACNVLKAGRMPTIRDSLKWNALAAVWTNIRPVSLDPYIGRACAYCGTRIALERHLLAAQSDNETETCSSSCHTKWKIQRRRSKQEQATVGSAAASAPNNGTPALVNRFIESGLEAQ